MSTSHTPTTHSDPTVDFLEVQFKVQSNFTADSAAPAASAMQIVSEQIDRIRALHAQDEQRDARQLEQLAGVRATEAGALEQLQAELELLQSGTERDPRSYGWDTLAQADLERRLWTGSMRRVKRKSESEAAFAERSIFAQVCSPSAKYGRATSRESIDDVQRRIFQQVAGGNHGR